MWFKLLMVVHLCVAFPLKCPEPAQWALRANSHCANPSKYFCLKNDLINGYSENCTRSDFQQPGRKAVLRGGIDAEICSIERYQPFPIKFFTNASTNCMFLKSFCNDEGQVVYDPGNRNTDTSCRCDYRKGYDFIVKPNNPCFCKPSHEDCSCFLKTCSNTSHTISPDYQCIYITKVNLVTQCRPITDEEDIRRRISDMLETTLIEHNVSSPVKWNHRAAMTLLLILMCGGVTFTIIFLKTAIKRLTYRICCRAAMDTQESLRSTPKGKRASYTKGRSPNELNSRRRQSALDFKSIASELDEHRCGCSLDCYSKFKPADIFYWRMKIHSIPEGNERMEKICQIIRLSAVNLQKHERCQLFHVDQRSVCRKAFISLVLRISIPTFTRAKRRLISKTSTPAKLEKKKTHSWRGKICEGFLRAYIKSACDSDPSKTRYRMPVGISRIRLFNLYRNTHTDDGIAKSAFYVILKQKFPDLSFNATQRFTKCTQCHDLCKMIEEEKDPIILMELEELLDFHHRQQQLEREAYYVRRGMAEMRPDEYVSIILDGMDQNKTDLPHYVKWNNPNGAGALKLRTHVVGSIVHGRGKQYFLDYNQFKHDTNLTLSCLLRILQKEAKEKQLPPTLFVQLDNTCRENKNKYFVGMMAYLVKKKIVKEVWMSFLIVGHTHEDVDQSFSKISHKLRTNDAITLPELHTLIRESQSPLPEIEDTRGVWNISSWLEDYVNQIHNVTFPKLYRIFNDAVGHTTVKFKVFSTDDVWHPSHNERPLEIFKINKGEQALPPGFPALVDQQLDHDFVKDLKRSVERDYKLANFSEERMSWWKIFMDQPIIPPNQQETEWPLNNLNQYRPAASKATLGEKEQELVDKYLTKRNEFKEVYTNQVEVGAARGTHQDRRRYITGKMVVIKLTELNAKVGKVIKQDGDILTVEQFKQDGNKFIPTGEMENYDIFNCFPGSFDLTKSGNLPQNEKVKLDLNGLKI